MKTVAAFVTMLALAGAGSLAVWTSLEKALMAEKRTAIVADQRITVLAGHALTLSLGSELARGTGITVRPAWEAGTGWDEQAEAARSPGKFAEAARAAQAVLTLRTAARDDALWAAAHAANPRCVELDASAADDQRTPVVRLRAGVNEGTAFALSLTSAARVAERIAAEFTAAQPVAAVVIAENLRRVKERLFRLRAEGERQLAEAAQTEVAVFSPAFDALLEDLGVQALVRVESEPARWTEAEHARILAELKRAGVKVSLHAFPPSAAVETMLKEAGVKALVLDPLTQAPAKEDAFFVGLEKNSAALAGALTKKP